MADNSFRSYRGGDPYARSAAAPTAPSREPSPDPLAELARLIGQNDPFADFNRDGRPAPAESHYDNGQHAQSDWASDSFPEPDRYGASPHEDPRLAPQYQDEQPAERPFPGTALRFDDRSHDDDHRDHDDRSPLQARHPSSFVPAPPAGHDYEDEHDDHHDHHDDHDEHDEHDEHDAGANRYQPEEFYEDAPNRRRRGGLVVVMAVLGLAVLGTAGAFAYRAMFGGAMLPSLPPIIKASATPSKVVPSTQNADSGKAADRLASAGQAEQVVSREEQPVELKDATTRSVAPRVISTIPVAPTASTAAPVAPVAAQAPPSSPAAAAPDSPPGTAAPKKVRTVTIRPDQVGAAGATAAAPPAPAATSRGRAVATHAGSLPPPSPPPAQAMPAQAATASGNPSPTGSASEPLALVPTGGQGDAAATAAAPPSRARVHAALARAAAPPPAERATAAPVAAGGGYAVQVSSQHSEAEAHSAFKSLQSKFPTQLGGHDVIVRRADLGSKGIYYRAMVGPFASMEEAAGMCSSLKAAGGTCLIQKN